MHPTSTTGTFRQWCLTSEIHFSCSRGPGRQSKSGGNATGTTHADVVERVGIVDREADYDHVRVGVREWAQAVVVLLPGRVPERELDEPVVDLDVLDAANSLGSACALAGLCCWGRTSSQRRWACNPIGSTSERGSACWSWREDGDRRLGLTLGNLAYLKTTRRHVFPHCPRWSELERGPVTRLRGVGGTHGAVADDGELAAEFCDRHAL